MKKIIALLMALMMVVGMVSCGSSASDTTSEPAESTADSSAETADEAAAEETTDETAAEETADETAAEETASTDEKTITVDVVFADESTKEYTYTTDAEFLGEVLLSEGLVEGSESEYGLYIETVDGVYADYDADGAYWAIYVNGEYGMYGADTQPIADGDVFTLAYEVYEG